MADETPNRAHPADRIEAIVRSDGSVAPALGEPLVPVPAELVELAQGLLYERCLHVGFVWSTSLAREHWQVDLIREMLPDGPACRVHAWRLRELAYGLSPRELDIVTLIAAGCSNRDIAEGLVLSLRTVTTHVTNLMRKLGATNRAQVGATAYNQSLLRFPLPVEDIGALPLTLARIAASKGRRRDDGLLSPRTPVQSPLTIGALIPRAGRAADDGNAMLRGALLAVEQINARGGIRGRSLNLLPVGVDIDDERSLRGGLDRLIRRGVEAVTSGYFAHQLVAIDRSGVEGIPFLHSSASAATERFVSADRDRYRGVFQFCPPDADYAPGFVKHATDLRAAGLWRPGSPRLVVVQQSDWAIVDFGVLPAQRLGERHGWEVETVSVADGRTGSPSNWSDAAVEAARRRPAAVMLASYFVEDHAAFMAEFLRRGADALVHAVYAPSIPEFKHRLGDGAEGIIWATTTGTYSDRVGARFVEQYRRRFGVEPGRSHAGLSFDRVEVLAQAWGQSDPSDFDAVAARLLETRHRGVNGPYSFETPGGGTLGLGSTSEDPSLAQAHTVFQIQDGQDVLIHPRIYAAGRFRAPPWTR